MLFRWVNPYTAVKGQILVCAMMKISGNSLETPPEAAEKFPPGKKQWQMERKKHSSIYTCNINPYSENKNIIDKKAYY